MKQQVSFEYEGRAYTVDVERSGDTLIIESEGQRYEVTLTGSAAAATAAASAALRPRHGSPRRPPAPVARTTPAAGPTAPAASRPAAAAAPGDVVAPMTGTIREMRAQVGAAVVEGQVLFVMEAMKMDLEVPAAVAGSVTEIAVRAGDSVVEAQLLARVDAG